MQRKSWILLGLFFLALVLWFAVSPFLKAKKAFVDKEAEGLFQVQVGVPEQSFVEPFYDFNGVTAPSAEVDLKAKGNGTVASILAPEGSMVKKGTPLIELSNNFSLEKLRETEAAYKKAQLAYEAYQKLAAGHHVSTLQLKEAETALKQAKYAFKTAKKAHVDRRVFAPFDGIINNYKVDEGDAIYASGSVPTAVGNFVRIDPLEVIVQANQHQVKKIKKGQRVDVMFEEGETVSAQVAFVEANAHKLLQTFGVHVFLKNKDRTLKAGISVRVKIYLPEEKVARLPMTALIYQESGTIGVKVVDRKSKVRFKPVRLMQAEKDHFLITGLKGHERVIYQGHSYVQTGEKVTPVAIEV